jgi:CHAT domain-containing protein
MRCFSLSVFLLMFVLTAPVSAQADKYAEFRSLTRDLAATVEATANKLHAKGIDGYAPGSDERETVNRMRTRLEQLSQIPTPTPRQIRTAGFEVGRLAEYGPELYASVVNDPTMRARILSAERAYGMQVFAPPELFPQALKIIGELVALARTKPSVDPSALTEDSAPSKEDLDDIEDELKKTGERIRAGNLANLYIAAQSGEMIYRFYGTLRASGRIASEALDTQIMSYLVDAQGPAYKYYRLHAFYGSNHALAVRLGALYLTKNCHDTQNFSFSCFTVMSQTAFNYFRLRDDVKYRATLQMLDRALGEHQRLRLASSPTAGMSSADIESQKNALMELRAHAPSMEKIMRGDSEPWDSDEMQTAMAGMIESQASSYWIARAAGKNLHRLIKAMAASQEKSSFESDWTMMLVIGAHLRAGELADHDVTLATINGMRQVVTALAEEEEVKIDLSVIDLMEIGALYEANRLDEASRLAKKLRLRPAFHEQKGPAKPTQFAILSSCHTAASFAPSDDQKNTISDEQYLLGKLEMKIGLKKGKRIPTASTRQLMEYEARAMFMRTDSRNEKREALSPSDFLATWPDYSKVFAADKASQRRLAKAAKCLLARPDIAARLGLDFVNKGNKERQTLNAAIFALLKDSGVFEQNNTVNNNEDFVLLQAASIMQAHNGISSATARSVFASSDVRNAVRNSELGMAQFTDQLSQMEGGPDLSKMMHAMRAEGVAGLEQMLSIMLENPDEFAKYSELKNQSIATLAEVKKSLKADEASLLLTLFDSKLVSVVVRHDSAKLLAADISRKEMKDTVTKLQASINFLSQESTSLPPDYRVDIAWQLYKQLFEPAVPLLAGVNTLYLVVGEDLAPIPFAALVTATPPAQSSVDFSTYRQLKWLGDKYAFVSLPSVHALLKNANAANKQGNAKLLGVGEPAVAGQVLIDLRLSPMPDTGSLLKRAGKPNDPPPLLRAKANYADLLGASNSGILSSSDITLINSHALAAGQSVRYGTQEPAILLAPTKTTDPADFLDPSKVTALKLSLRLIMLLACETAGGRTIENSQPYAGLVNSFFFAGADSVVATNLPINPAVAEDFAVQFLHYVRDENKSSARALQMAAADVRCANDSMACAAGEKYVWAHPAYWSQFTLVGSGR